MNNILFIQNRHVAFTKLVIIWHLLHLNPITTLPHFQKRLDIIIEYSLFIIPKIIIFSEYHLILVTFNTKVRIPLLTQFAQLGDLQGCHKAASNAKRNYPDHTDSSLLLDKISKQFSMM